METLLLNDLEKAQMRDCELDVSAFQADEDEDENRTSPSYSLVDSKRDHNFMGGEWKWNC